MGSISGVHETTIYRRWKTVNALALDACLRGVSAAVPVPNRGSLNADLVALSRSIMTFLQEPDGKAMLDVCRIGDLHVANVRAAFFAKRFAAVDIALEHDLHFDRTTLQGVTFNLIGAVAEFGKLGIVSIARSLAEAETLYHRTVQALDAACA